MSTDHSQACRASYRTSAAQPLQLLSKKISSPDDVYLISERHARERQEVLRVILLTDQHRVIRSRVVSRGTLSSFIAHPREVYRPAVLAGAAAIVLVHNHPNGDPTPSQSDIALTQQLWNAGTVLGIRLLDHVIVASSGYCSLAAKGVLPETTSTPNAEGIHQ